MKCWNCQEMFIMYKGAILFNLGPFKKMGYTDIGNYTTLFLKNGLSFLPFQSTRYKFGKMKEEFSSL